MVEYKDMASDTKQVLRDELKTEKFRNEKLHKMVEKLQESSKEKDEQISLLTKEVEEGLNALEELDKEIKDLKRKFVPDLKTISGITEQVPVTDMPGPMTAKHKGQSAKMWRKGLYSKTRREREKWVKERILDNKDIK